jgi:hypothetical protein
MSQKIASVIPSYNHANYIAGIKLPAGSAQQLHRYAGRTVAVGHRPVAEWRRQSNQEPCGPSGSCGTFDTATMIPELLPLQILKSPC